MERTRRFFSPARGFTLIELMISVAILGLLLTGIYRIFMSQEKFTREQEQAAMMQEDFRALSEFLNQELSWAGFRAVGTAISKAAVSEVIFQADFPGGSNSATWVRYLFVNADKRLYRATASTSAAIAAAPLQVLADNVDSARFLYFDFVGSQYGSTTMTAPTFNASLNGINRVRAAITIRSKSPESTYVHPQYGDHYRRREGIIDIKLRNLEDVFVGGGAGTPGGCGFATLSLLNSSTYTACADTPIAAPVNVDGNPKFRVHVDFGTGQPDNTTPFYLFASGGYTFVAASDLTTPVNTSSSRTNGDQDFYLTFGPGCGGTAGQQVVVTGVFTPSEAGCVEKTTAPINIMVTPGLPAGFDRGVSFPTGISAEIIDLGTGVALSPQPPSLPACPGTEAVGVRLKVKVVDQCGNGIAGETVSFVADKGSFLAGTTDNGDGTYEIVYQPPNTVSGLSETDLITASWTNVGSDAATHTVTFGPGSPKDMNVGDIEGPRDGTGAFLYQFAKSGTNGFRIERVSNERVRVTFRVVDGCGNLVAGEESVLTASSSTGNVGPVTAVGDGTYWVEWENTTGCGAGSGGHTITITDTHILDVAKAQEVVTFDLLTTSEVARLVLGLSHLSGLKAGCTSDSVVVSARIERYDAAKNLCVNVPGPFPVTFVVAGQTPGKGNGSFSQTSPFDTSSLVSTSDGSGTATATLYPGTAVYDTDLVQKLVVTATADVQGAVSPITAESTISVDIVSSVPDGTSGFYDASFSIPKGVGEGSKSFPAGGRVYIQVKDCDENRNPLAMDSQSSPYLTLTLLSERTGDRLQVRLTETAANSALFRPGPLYGGDGGVPTADVGETGVALADNILQVRNGDRITAFFNDIDGPHQQTFSWEVYTSGPRWMVLYKVNGSADVDTILWGGSQITTLSAGDKYRPVLFFPEYANDGSLGVTASQIQDSTPGETQTYPLREYQDTGMMAPYVTAPDPYSILLSKTDPGAGYGSESWLLLPYTPVNVTVTWPPSPGTAVHTAVFRVRDSDLPVCTVTSPTSGSTVSGTVPVTVTGEDVYNAFDPGITEVRFYVDGIYISSALAPLPVVSPWSFTFDWQTVDSLGNPLYLDGSHIFTGYARDRAGNWSLISPAVTVTLANGILPLTIISPPANSVWSSRVPVTVTTTVDLALGSYTVSLTADGTTVPLTRTGPDTWTGEWSTSSSSDGTHLLAATLRDNVANSATSATQPVIVDHSGPAISFSTSPYWVNAGSFPIAINITITDANGVDPASITAAISGACPEDLTLTPTGIDTYQAMYYGPCSGVVGSITLTVAARDLATPPNTGTASASASIDTKLPVMDPLLVTPLYGSSFSYYGHTIAGFLRGPETVSSSVLDDYPALAAVVIQSLGEPRQGMSGSGLVVDTLVPVAPATGAFSYAWGTTGSRPGGGFFEDGLYLVAVGGLDRALNATLTPRWGLYYLDNGIPWCGGPWPGGGPIGLYGGNLRFNADANFGFLQRVELVVMQNGEHPDTSTPLFSRTVDFAQALQALRNDGTVTWRPSGLPDGVYHGYIRATDWAGNQPRVWDGVRGVYTTWNGPNWIDLSTVRLDSPVGTFSSPGSGYNLQLTGRVLAGAVPKGGVEVRVRVTRYDAAWTYLGQWDNWSFPAYSAASDGGFNIDVGSSMPFAAGDRCYADFYLGPSQSYQGYLRGDSAPLPLLIGWLASGRRSVLDPQATVTPMGGTSYQIALSGTLTDTGTGPVTSGVAMNLNYYQYDQNGNTEASYPVTALTDGSGKFTAVFNLTLDPGDRLSIDVQDDLLNGMGWVNSDWQGWRWPCVLNLGFN